MTPKIERCLIERLPRNITPNDLRCEPPYQGPHAIHNNSMEIAANRYLLFIIYCSNVGENRTNYWPSVAVTHCEAQKHIVKPILPQCLSK